MVRFVLLTIKWDVDGKTLSKEYKMRGICGCLDDRIEKFYSDLESECKILKYNFHLSSYFETWDKYSGNDCFPIKLFGISPQACYYRNKEKWTGEYGKLRYELLCYIINEIEKEILKLNI